MIRLRSPLDLSLLNGTRFLCYGAGQCSQLSSFLCSNIPAGAGGGWTVLYFLCRDCFFQRCLNVTTYEQTASFTCAWWGLTLCSAEMFPLTYPTTMNQKSTFYSWRKVYYFPVYLFTSSEIPSVPSVHLHIVLPLVSLPRLKSTHWNAEGCSVWTHVCLFFTVKWNRSYGYWEQLKSVYSLMQEYPLLICCPAVWEAWVF